MKKPKCSHDLHETLDVHELQVDSLHDDLSDISDVSDLNCPLNESLNESFEEKENSNPKDFETLRPESLSPKDVSGLDGLVSIQEDPVVMISPISKNKIQNSHSFIFKTPLPRTFERDDLA